MRTALGPWLPVAIFGAWGCSGQTSVSDEAPPPIVSVAGSTGAPPGGAGGTPGAPPVSPGTVGGGAVVQISGSAGMTNQAGAGPACASVRAEATLLPVYLAFAFDVSGSMGKGDEPWHDRTLKWEPVVAATRAFLEAPAAAGLNASMTFFPADGGEDVRCEDDTYLIPDVPMTALPAPEFGAALDDIGSQDWRGGTPTLHVLRGVIDYVNEQRPALPGKYAVVLVTDGYPQDCDDDEISELASIAAGVAVELPTYVIGVQNPPIDGAPDSVSNLEQIAVAGGTEHAYLIDTGDPEATAQRFGDAIEAIRGSAVSCVIEIPSPPDGRTFDKERVTVRYETGAGSMSLDYDPACASALAWHYDNPAAPGQIILCESACGTIEADVQAELDVEFGCERVLEIPE